MQLHCVSGECTNNLRLASNAKAKSSGAMTLLRDSTGDAATRPSPRAAAGHFVRSERLPGHSATPMSPISVIAVAVPC